MVTLYSIFQDFIKQTKIYIQNVLPKKVSELTNDVGYITSHQDISGKQDKLTFDMTPTANSSNPVTSGGIKTALDTVSKKADTQADWNSTDSSSIAFIKNIPNSIKSINNSSKFRIKSFNKTNNNGRPTYRIIEELTNYHPTNRPSNWKTYGFSIIALVDIRDGNGFSLDPTFMYAALGYEYNMLKSTSSYDFPVVLHNIESDKYYVAIRTNGSYKTVTLMGDFCHPDIELGEEILAQDRDGTPPSGWELTYKPQSMLSMERLQAGMATTATKLQTARTISLTGDITGSATFDGSSNISINTSKPYVVGETKVYEVNLSTLDTTKFYPIIFNPESIILRCEIHSPSKISTFPYNQNVISFRLLAMGWQDTPRFFSIDEYNVHTKNEITIGCIGRGNKPGYACVWVRGGLTYRIVSNRKPILHTEDVTFGGTETYTVGTNYYGGTGNKDVSIIFTPQQTIKEGSWHDGMAYGLFEKATKDDSGNVITTTYAKKSEIPSVPVKGVKINGSTSNLTPDTSGIVTIPAIPTKVSTFTNDSGYLTTHQDLSGYQTKLTFDRTPTANSSNPVTSAGIKAAIDAKTVDLSNYYTKTQVDSAISTAISAIVDGDNKRY